MRLPISQDASLDKIDRMLLSLLSLDSRATYQELGRAVRLSANAAAERVRRMRRSGLIRAYTIDVDPQALGRTLHTLTSIKLRDHVSRRQFEDDIAEHLPHIVSAAHITGDYDYELVIGCRDTAELEGIVDRLKENHWVREVNSRIVLRSVPLDPLRILRPPP